MEFSNSTGKKLLVRKFTLLKISYLKMSDFIHITFDIEYDAITYVCIIISLIENEIFMIDYSKAENIKFQKGNI